MYPNARASNFFLANISVSTETFILFYHRFNYNATVEQKWQNTKQSFFVVLLLASRDCCAGIQNLLQISKGLFTLRAETQNGRIQLLLLSLSLSLLVCLYARSLGLNIPRYICFSTYIRMYIVEHWSMSILLKYLCLIYRSLCADQRVFMYRPRYTFE